MTLPGHRAIRTLLPMACDGVGPSMTCLNLTEGARQGGFAVDIFANRRSVAPPRVDMHLALPGPLARLPYKWVAPMASR
jgi:hypothetical protein